MQQSADRFNAEISTQSSQNGTSTDYECSIVGTNRAYDNDGEDLFGVGYFILEVAVQQVVYVTSDTEVDLAAVARIVQAGFSRGLGGRIKFRSLLTDLPVFETVVDVGVLDDSLSDPQDPPTSNPSTFPTALFLSPAPSGVETTPSSPSTSPAGNEAPIPSGIDTKHPNLAPLLAASIMPTKTHDLQLDSISSWPSSSSSPAFSSNPTIKLNLPVKPTSNYKPNAPTKQTSPTKPRPHSNVKDESLAAGFDRQPLIIAAIASGLATILVSCFFIFCVWYPFCWRKRDNLDAMEQPPRHRRRRLSASSHSSGSTHAAEAMIPGVLQLDDESRSLANTTVTQGTAKKGPTIYKKPSMNTWKKQSASTEPVSILDSFDESSVYTSTLGSTSSPDLDQTQDSNTMLLPNAATLHDMIVEATKDKAASVAGSVADPFDLDARVQNKDNQPTSESDSDPFLSPDQKDDEEKVSEQSSSDSDSDPFALDENEVKADNISLAAGFDPYAGDGDSSIGMTSLAISDSSFGPPMNESVGKVSLSSISTKTKRIDNLVSSVKPSSPYNDDVGWNEQQPALDSESEEEIDSRISVIADSSATLPSSSVTSATNNNLLRSILEDARLLAKKQDSSSRSVVSGKSAPSRLAWKNGHQEAMPWRAALERHAPPLLNDLITDNIELNEHADPSHSPSRGVDGVVNATTYGSPEQPTKFSHRTRFLDSDSILSDNDKLSDRVENQDRHSGGTRMEPLIFAPSSSDLSSTRERSTLGARPMQHHWGVVHDDDEELLVTPPSTPGMLGISKQVKPSHGLYEGEASLGARPRSLSPSRSAAWSASSFENDGKGQHGIHRENKSNPLSTISTLSDHVQKHLGEQKTASDEMSKTSLEDDLRELERHLVQTIQSSDDYSLSTDGVSTVRSTLITADQGRTRRIIVVAPPGKLGVTLADHHDGKGIIVSEIGPHSSMNGQLVPGDKLIAIDDEDVSNMFVNQITSMMASRSLQERRLTLLTRSVEGMQPQSQETKQDGTP